MKRASANAISSGLEDTKAPGGSVKRYSQLYRGYELIFEPAVLSSGRYSAQVVVRADGDEVGRGFYGLGEFANQQDAARQAQQWASDWIDEMSEEASHPP